MVLFQDGLDEVADMVLDELEQKDLLATPPGKSRSYNKTICKKTQWVTAIKSQAFDLEEEKPEEN